MGSSHRLQILSNLFLQLAACCLPLGPDLFFLKPIAGVHAQRWMGRNFRYFYSCIFHKYPFLARRFYSHGHTGPVDSFKVFTSHIMHRHYPAWCARDVHTRAFSLRHPGHIVPSSHQLIVYTRAVIRHNIYMGYYLTITSYFDKNN